VGPLTGTRLGVQPLHVAGLAFSEAGRDVCLDEARAVTLDEAPSCVARSTVGRNRRREYSDTVPREQVRHEPDAEDVRVAVLFAEREAPGKVCADDIAV